MNRNIDVESYLKKSMIRGTYHTQNNNMVNYKQVNITNINDRYSEQSRTIKPAWEIRNLEINRWEPQLYNPQENVLIPFQNSLQTRIIERDNYIPNYPLHY